MFCDELLGILNMQAAYSKLHHFALRNFGCGFYVLYITKQAGPLLINLVSKNFSPAGVILPFYIFVFSVVAVVLNYSESSSSRLAVCAAFCSRSLYAIVFLALRI